MFLLGTLTFYKTFITLFMNNKQLIQVFFCLKYILPFSRDNVPVKKNYIPNIHEI